MNYGMPYMGSKSDVIDSIALNFPKADHFYDLFGGGGSVTHYMMLHKSHRYKNFYYNEINTNVATLLKRAIKGEFNYSRFKPEWIPREEFHKRKDQDGYVACVWSFGNNQIGYLFGEDVEPYKKSMHMAVVFDEFDKTAEKFFGFDVWPTDVKTIKQKRAYFMQKARYYNCGIDYAQARTLQQLQRLEQLQQLERLQRLQRLEQLQQLEGLEKLTITSLSYEQVEIKPNSIVYCDIPYEGTADYGRRFDKRKFLDWAASQTVPVFISEYQLNDSRCKHVYTIDKKITMSGNGKVAIEGKQEKLFWNGVSNG